MRESRRAASRVKPKNHAEAAINNRTDNEWRNAMLAVEDERDWDRTHRPRECEKEQPIGDSEVNPQFHKLNYATTR
jgi:hypothetical protein